MATSCRRCTCPLFYPVPPSNQLAIPDAFTRAQEDCACGHTGLEHGPAPAQTELEARQCQETDTGFYSPRNTHVSDPMEAARGLCLCGQPYYLHMPLDSSTSTSTSAFGATVTGSGRPTASRAGDMSPPTPVGSTAPRPHIVHGNSVIGVWSPPPSLQAALSAPAPAIGRPRTHSRPGVSASPLVDTAGASTSTLQHWPNTDIARAGRTHGIYNPQSLPPAVPGASTSTGPFASTSASGERGSKAAVSYSYIVCIHTEDPCCSEETQTGAYFRQKLDLRAPSDSTAASEFVRGFNRMGLAFDVNIVAKPTALIGRLLVEPLATHMKKLGLELRNVEGLSVLPEATHDYKSFDHAWKFLMPVYAARKGSNGAILKSADHPHSSALSLSRMSRLAKRIPSEAPPNADRSIIVIAPVRRVVIGPLKDPDDPVPAGLGHPTGPLHLCLGLRAWPAQQVLVNNEGNVDCVPGCDAQVHHTQQPEAAASSNAAASSSAFPVIHAPAPGTPFISAPTPASRSPIFDDGWQFDPLQMSAPPMRSVVPASETSVSVVSGLGEPPAGGRSTASGTLVSRLGEPSTVRFALPASPAPVQAVAARPVRIRTPVPTQTLRTPSAPATPRPSLSITQPARTAAAAAAVAPLSAPLSPSTMAAPVTVPSRRSAASTLQASRSTESAGANTTTTAGTPSLAGVLSYLQKSAQETDGWLALLRSFQPLYPTHNIRIEAPSVEEGAKALLRAVNDVALGHPVADYIGESDSVEVMYFSEANFPARYPHCTIGYQAVGPGPLGAVFGDALKLMVQDEARWTKTSDGEYYTPVIPGTRVTHEDLTYFKACGIMLRLALFWDQDLLPISPMLLVLLISDSLEAAMDREFLTAVAPGLAARLSTWPPPRTPSVAAPENLVNSIRLGQDPMNMIMEFIPNTQVAHIRNLSPAAVEDLTLPLASGLLFQTSNVKHAIFQALRDGLNHGHLEKSHIGTLVTSTLLQTFQNRPVPQIMAGLCANRRLMHYSSLIAILHYDVPITEDHPNFNRDIRYEDVAKSWMEAFQRYLAGKGHPDHEMFGTPIGNASDTFRPALFLRAISDSDFLPRASLHDDGARLQINFVCSLEEGDSNALVCFHTCSTSMDVVINEDVARRVNCSDGTGLDSGETTEFDVYIHALLLGARNEYNTM